MNATRRTVMGLTAVLLLVSFVSLALALTTHKVAPAPCPHCGSTDVSEWIRFSDSTRYRCNACGKEFKGPMVQDFSWAAALQEWLGE